MQSCLCICSSLSGKLPLLYPLSKPLIRKGLCLLQLVGEYVIGGHLVTMECHLHSDLCAHQARPGYCYMFDFHLSALILGVINAGQALDNILPLLHIVVGADTDFLHDGRTTAVDTRGLLHTTPCRDSEIV